MAKNAIYTSLIIPSLLFLFLFLFLYLYMGIFPFFIIAFAVFFAKEKKKKKKNIITILHICELILYGSEGKNAGTGDLGMNTGVAVKVPPP